MKRVYVILIVGLIYIFVIGIRLYALGPISEEEVLVPCGLPLNPDKEEIITPFSGSLEDTAGEEINVDEPPLREESRPLPSLPATASENRPDLEKVTTQSVGTSPQMVEGNYSPTQIQNPQGSVLSEPSVELSDNSGSGKPISAQGLSQPYVKSPKNENHLGSVDTKIQPHYDTSKVGTQSLSHSAPKIGENRGNPGAPRVNITGRVSKNIKLPEGATIITEDPSEKDGGLISEVLLGKERPQNTRERTFPSGFSPVRESSSQVNHIGVPRSIGHSGFRHSADVSVNSPRREQTRAFTSLSFPDSNSPQVSPPEEAITVSLENVPPGEMRDIVGKSLGMIMLRYIEDGQEGVDGKTSGASSILGDDMSVFDINLEQEYRRAVIINNFVTGIKVFTNLEFSGSFKRRYRKITQELWKFYTPRDIAREIWKKLQLDDSMDNVRIKLVISDSQGLANKIFILISALLIFSLTLGYVLGRSYGVLKREPLSYQFREFL